MQRKAFVICVAAIVGEAVAVVLKRRTLFQLDTAVRCRKGHLFTTWWIPGASFKAVRFGWWRFQWCPAGRHWSLVVPVDEAELSVGELVEAHALHDLRIP